MSGLLPFGDLAHTVFISCQMLFLIILSFPVVPPPRQCRPPRLLPLAPCLSPRGRENPIPFKSTYSASPTALFFVLILISLLSAAPTLFTPAALCWLTCLGKVWMGRNCRNFGPFCWTARWREDKTFILIATLETEEDVLAWKTLPRGKGSHSFHVDHSLGNVVFSKIFPPLVVQNE